ncbi:S-layer homology domain-containing protein [Geosporobacter ferrireducens]|uniref:SLH domain-containing protein n=1 Tax=Geosporobacter ferrireducens TaxID=1424294 RepID=A0A1D8GF86_9FIRM|nr:S-layer homology domain-containing protein [Geosporobacter ferrireducens]AOT69564.1 hypothetical protein Gferi_08220 [Geosporobacter ferrireducens]
MLGKKMKFATLLLTLVLILSQPAVFAQETDKYAVEIIGAGVKTELKLTLEDLEGMPAEAQIEEAYIYNSKTGEKSAKVKGVSLAYILREKAGVTGENAEVTFTASDGYPIDPQSLQDILNTELKYVLAYEVDGEAVNNDGIAENEEITVYRKVKAAGEFGTVFKMVVKITVGEPVEATDVSEATSEAIQFTDITETYQFAEAAIQELTKKGIISGMGDGKFNPQGTLTRAQICTMMAASLGYEPKEYKGGFTDVNASDWFAPYVQAAADAGLFTGYTDGSFKPNQPITRQEMAAVAGKAAVENGVVAQEKMDKFVMEKSKFTDKDSVPAWAANAVAWLEAQGAFTGVAADRFEPAKVVNRAEAAVILYNTLFK